MEIQLTVGLLYRGPVRRYLEEAQFYGKVSWWKEIKGPLDSEFLIRGASQGVASDIHAWIARVKEASE